MTRVSGVFPGRVSWGDLAVAAAALMAAWFVFTGVRIGVVGWSATPFYDQWSWLLPEELIAQLFAQHNEHRIVVARLLFLVDAWLTGGQGLIPTAAMYLFNAAGAALVWTAATRAFAVGDRLRRALAALVAAAFYFTGFQFENFTSGFQSQFTGVFFFAIAAFAALSRYREKSAPVWFALAIAAAVTAAGCMANGVFVSALLVPLALLLGVRMRDVLILAVCAALVWTLYLTGYGGSGGHGDPLERLQHLPAAVAFLLGYLGGAAPNSLSAVFALGPQGALLAQAFGLAGLALSAVIVVDALRTRDPWRLACAAMLLFVLASAGVTALGRAGFDPAGMLSNRYGAATAPFWTVIGVWLVARNARAWRLAGCIAAVALVVSVALAQKVFTGAALEFAWRKREAGAALMADAPVRDALLPAHPSPDYMVERAKRLRAAHLATFAQPWSRLLGAPAPTSAAICDGAIFAGASPASDGAWRISVRGRIDARAVAFIAAGRVVGLGVRHMRDDADQPWPFGKGRVPPIWSGFANLASRTDIAAVAVDAQGRGVCRVDGVIAAGAAGG